MELVQTLAPRLTSEQAQAALTVAVDMIGRTAASSTLEALTKVVQALVPRLGGEQVQAALNHVLGMTEPRPPGALAKAVEIPAPKLAGYPAQATLTPRVDAVRRTTEPDQLLALAQGVLALAPKLNGEQASMAAQFAQARLAMARNQKEAAAWAAVFVKLEAGADANDYLRGIITILKYPTVGWPEATKVVMQALRARFPDVSALNGDLDSALPWFREKLGPDIVAQPPVRPTSST